MATKRTTPASAEAAGQRAPSPVDLLRAFGVMVGGSAALTAAGAWSIAGTVRALLGGRRPGAVASAGSVGVLAYVLLVRPRLLTWGATPEERSGALPGDELVPEPGIQTTRAVTINAPVEEVWPWLAQLGQDRGGFYSYEWLENLAGCEMRNADRVHPAWQRRERGETVKLHWAHGLTLERFEPNRVYAFKGWYLVLEPLNGTTRLIARSRCPRGVAAVAYAILLEPPHFVMERKMLLGIKERAERPGAEANVD
jgi:hypothetical protein